MKKISEKIFITLTDQTGTTLVLSKIPEKIISLVPSQTELLFDLGLEENVIGITKFCIHPKDKCLLKHKIGGTKNFNIEKIKHLAPDLIIANKEENTKQGIEALRKDFPVYVSDIIDLTSALEMIGHIASLTDTTETGKIIIQKIDTEFDTLKSIPKKEIISVAYLIWNDPMMVAGGGNFIDSMLQLAGYKNVFTQKIGRYPIVSNTDLLQEKPELVFLSSEPFPFKDKHKVAIKNILPQSKIEIVDGEMFSWYGSRLDKTPKYLLQLKNKLNSMVVH